MAWIKAANQEFKIFIENRVNVLRNLIEPNLWNYCGKKTNPSDLITRVSQLYFTKNEGPQFMKENGLSQIYTKIENDDFLT